MARQMMKSIWIAALCGAWSLTARPQAGTGRIAAKVADTSGAAVSGATLRLLNTGIESSGRSGGDHVLDGIPAGAHVLEVAADGYATVLVDLRVTAGGTTRLDILLKRPWQTLGEVSVSADRRETREAVTPASITTFGTRDIRGFRLWDLKEISALVPGLYSADPGDGRNVTTIRGIGTTSYDPAVVTYIDGVSQFNLDTYIPQLIDVERIEVLRGPQGTLFGRNAMGGVIQVTTRRPGNRTRVGLETSHGNFGLQRTTATLRTPVVKDRLWFGLALQQQSRLGYHRNRFTGEDFDGMAQRTLNMDLRYASGGAWSARLNLKGHRTENEGAFPLSPVDDAADRPYELDQNATATMLDRGSNASFSVARAGARVRLDLQTAWQSNHRIYDGPLDGDFSRADIVSIFNDYGDRFNRVGVWTQELRLSSAPSAGGRLQWVSGLFLFAQDNPVRQATVFGRDAGLFGIPDKEFSLVSQNLGRGSGAALFGQGTYLLTDRLSLVAGLRVDRERRRLDVRGEYEKGASVRFVTRPDTSGTGIYGALSPKLGLQWALPAGQFAYAGYSRGFRAGGLTTLGSDPGQPPLVSYDPEYSDNLEIGFKGGAGEGRLSYRFAAFHTVMRDVQVPTLLLPDAVTVTRNAGRMRSYGAEGEAEARLPGGFSLTARVGLTEARYTRLAVPVNGREQDLSGNRQVFTPSHTALVVAEYVRPLGKRQRWNVEARVEGTSTGRQYFDLSNNIGQPAYGLVNARAGIAGRRWGLHLWARNLTGDTHIAYAYDFGVVHLGAPRTWGVTISRGG
jgi:iron complex outermembrane receptor protein